MKTRIIKTDIHTDETMLSLTPDVRSICKYLYTNGHIDLTDIYKIPVQLVQLETGYDITTIKLALDILQENLILVHYDYLWIKLLREDFASLNYSGKHNDVAIKKYLDSIHPDILFVLNGFDSSIDTTMDSSIHTNYKSKIRNKNTEIRKKETKITKFKKPTIEEIISYCNERNNHIDPNQFFDFYESNGWKVSKNPMKDWKASVRTWERRNGYSESTRSNGPAINLDDKSAVDKLLSKKK